MVGALLAYYVLPSADPRLRDALALGGVGMILLAVVGYSAETPFPGLAALLPCGGAALVIYAGQQGESTGGRMLSTPGMVWVGKISYSLYLWHWPLLIFAGLYFGASLGAVGVAVLVALSVLLAAVSARFIERPFRGRRAILTRRRIFQLSAAGIALFVGVGAAGVLSNGWSQRYPPEVARILFAEQDRDPRQHQCLNTREENNGCAYGARGAPPSVALFGDSHAAVYSVMLGELAAEKGQSLLAFTMPSCPPVDDWALPDRSSRERCLDFQRRALEAISGTPSIRTVLLSGRFDGYPVEDPDSGFEAALRRSIHALRTAASRST